MIEVSITQKNFKILSLVLHKSFTIILLRHSKDRQQAMSRLVFYMNRCGDKLTNRTVLNKAKEILKSK